MASSEDLRRSVPDGSSVSALINDYRAQQEAWRAKAQDLARMRDALRTAADREARGIVAAAQRDIEDVLRKANEDLAALNAQVRALSEAAEGGLPVGAADGPKFGRRAGDIQQVAMIVRDAEHDLVGIGDSTRARLDVLSADAAADLAEAAVASADAPGRPAAAAMRDLPGPPVPADVERVTTTDEPVVRPIRDRRAGADGEHLSRPLGDSPEPPPVSVEARTDPGPPPAPSWRAADTVDLIVEEPAPAALEDAPRSGLPRSLRTFIAAFTVLGALTLAATGWWFWQSRGGHFALTNPVASASTPAPSAVPPANATSPASTTGANPGAAAPGDTSAVPPGAPESEPAASAPTSSELAVRVEVVRLSWLRVTVDDRVVAVREFQPGESQVFKGGREVQIRAGDAGAVRVAVDGGESVPLGRDGQSVTRRFAAPDATPPAAATPPVSGVVPDSVGTNGPLATTPTSRGDGSSGAGLADAGRQVAPAAAMIQPPVAAASNTAVPSTAASAAPRGGDMLGGIPASGPGGAGESVTHSTLEGQFVRAVGRWFESYQRQDRAGMSAFSSGPPSVSDERTDGERAPRGSAGVRRTFEDIRLQLVTENAVFTTKMTERFDDPASGRPRQLDSFVSQLWTLRAGVWQLEDVRVVPTSKLRQNFR